jgi:hypothetical protein
LTVEQRADQWLRFVLEDPDETLDLEALVWLASQGANIEHEITQTRAMWKRAEERSINIAVEDGVSLSAARKVEGLSPYKLPDFWKSAKGPHPAEATILRVIDWCGITGFDPWLNRYAKEVHEDMLLGGPDPEQMIWWLFDHCRSPRAMFLLKNTLNRCLDVIRIVPLFVDVPWMRFEGKVDKNGPIYVESIAYAASLAFCETRLQGNDANGLVERAVSLLEKKQRSDGAWGYKAQSTDPSIEVTVMAVHAIAHARHPDSKRILEHAVAWLRSQQSPGGYWQEDSSPSTVKLTVMALDALALATGTRNTLDTKANTTGASVTPTRKSRTAVRKRNRFRVSLSFPGENRNRVEGVSNLLVKSLGREAVFYDNNFKAEIAIPDADEFLQDIYLNQSDLVVVWFGRNYQKKMWCHLEWRAIKQIIGKRKPKTLMFVKVDDFRPRGIFATDGYIDVKQHTDEQIAELILKRLDLIDQKRPRQR